jgi:hypothetical protein
VVEQNAARVLANPNYYRQRQQIAEHQFGTLKRQWGFTHTLMRKKQHVLSEVYLCFSAYNLLRCLQILGEKELQKRLKALWLFLKLKIGVYKASVRLYLFPMPACSLWKLLLPMPLKTPQPFFKHSFNLTSGFLRGLPLGTIMKNWTKNKKRVFLILPVLISFSLFLYIKNKIEISKLEYGEQANSLRLDLKVPIIDSYMSAEYPSDRYFGNRWESWRNKPKSGQVLHAWKRVTPSEENEFILRKEWDAFRKKDKDGRILQLNISSEIIRDSISIRTAKLFYFDSEPRNERDFNESQIDSIAQAWNLKYLIKTVPNNTYTQCGLKELPKTRCFYSAKAPL